MSEIKLNLIDSQSILNGTIHASIGDSCVAALSAEPETIAELQAALERYEKCAPNFSTIFARSSVPDTEPYDAGLLMIDLAARIVVCDSTYSMPGPCGSVRYHDGTQRTDLRIQYWLPADWLFVDSAEEYEGTQANRRARRAETTPLDARPILYGRPLTEFIATNVRSPLSVGDPGQPGFFKRTQQTADDSDSDPVSDAITAIHRSWLMTPRDDLHSQSPREVMLAKQKLINFDLETRTLQWSFLLEGPPCLSRDSFAYRFAGFGLHEWVIYYGLVRYLLSSAMGSWRGDSSLADKSDLDAFIIHLERLKLNWLEEPNSELDGRRPFLILDNERKRLPEAMGGRSMVIDENCPLCKMMGDESESGLGIYFWHLDTSNMDDAFAFSNFRTIEEWEEEQKSREEFDRKFQSDWQEREARRTRGEIPSASSSVSPLSLDDFFPWNFESEPPES